MLLAVVTISNGCMIQKSQALLPEPSTTVTAPRQLPDPDTLFSEALQIAETLPDPYGKAEALSAIALQLMDAGHPEQADAVFADAVEIAVAYDNHKTERSEAVALNLAKAGKFDQALQRAEQINVTVLKPKTQASIAVEMAAAGQAQPAKALLIKTLEQAQSLTGSDQSVGGCYLEKADALGVIAGHLAQVGEFQTALTAAAQSPNRSDTTGEVYLDNRSEAYT